MTVARPGASGLPLAPWARQLLSPQAIDLAHQRSAGEHAEDLASAPVGVSYEPALEVGGLWAIPEGASQRRSQ